MMPPIVSLYAIKAVYEFTMDVVFNSVNPAPAGLSREEIKQWAVELGIIGPDFEYTEDFWAGRNAIQRALTEAGFEARHAPSTNAEGR